MVKIVKNEMAPYRGCVFCVKACIYSAFGGRIKEAATYRGVFHPFGCHSMKSDGEVKNGNS